jgi:transposase
MNHVPRSGWAPKGKQVIQQKPGIRGQRYSLLLCVRNRTANPVVDWLLVEGSLTAVAFHTFLSSLELDNNVMLVLDNAKIHKATNKLRSAGKSTIAELAQERNINLNYLPPYVPALNPTEYCFNTIRQCVEKHKPRNREELEKAIREGLTSLKNMHRTFLHAFKQMCKPPPGW